MTDDVDSTPPPTLEPADVAERDEAVEAPPTGSARVPDPISAIDDARAQNELRALAGVWQERVEAFDTTSGGDAMVEQRSLWADALARFARNRLALASALLVSVYVLLAILVPIFDNGNWKSQDFNHDNLKPSMSSLYLVPPAGDTKHAESDCYSRALTHPTDGRKPLTCVRQHRIQPFGTDNFGHDEFVVAWRGARISLAIAIAVALTIMVVGTIYGAISGYVGGRVDNAMMRLLDALYGLPYLPFAIIFVILVRTKFPNAPPLAYMVPALSITTWFTSARIMRGQVLSLKENEYVESARSQGAVTPRIVFRHIVPNALGVFVVAVFLEVPGAILGEAFLSVIGLGVQSPDASWGRMANNGIAFVDTYPILILVPGILIASTVLATVSMADGVRDALDPRGKTN